MLNLQYLFQNLCQKGCLNLQIILDRIYNESLLFEILKSAFVQDGRLLGEGVFV